MTRDRSAGSCFIEGTGNSNTNATTQQDTQAGSRALCGHRRGSSALAEDRHRGHILGPLVGCVLSAISQDGENMSVALGSLVQAFMCCLMNDDFDNDISSSLGHRPGELGDLTCVFADAIFSACPTACAPTGAMNISPTNEYVIICLYSHDFINEGEKKKTSSMI